MVGQDSSARFIRGRDSTVRQNIASLKKRFSKNLDRVSERFQRYRESPP
jgi:hypothetical protein